MTYAATPVFRIARVAAVAALAVAAGALFTPAPAEAQHRHGYSVDGRYVDARARHHARRHAHRDYAPRVAAHQPRHSWRERHRAVHRNNRNNLWPVAAGVGLGVVAATAIANSRPRYVQQPHYPSAYNTNAYYTNAYYTDPRYANAYNGECWLEQRTVNTGYDRRVMTVRVCPHH